MTRRRPLLTAVMIGAYIAGTALIAVAAAVLVRPLVLRETPPAPRGLFGDRVLIVAPHPDDEVLSSGGLIQQLLARGAQVRVVIVTAGDGYARAARDLMGPRATLRRPGASTYLELGNIRHAESLAVARRLGLDGADVVSLGFPDTGTRTLWGLDWRADATHVGRNGQTAVPYAWAYAPGAPYSGRELAEELSRIVRDFAPDTVISSDARETHPDHAYVDAFTMLALAETGFSGHHLTYFVHSPRYPYPWAYLPFAYLTPPPAVRGGSTWYSVRLDAPEEQVKRQAIHEYRSQVSVPGFVFFLDSFVRRNELFDYQPAVRPARQSGDETPAAGADGIVAVATRTFSLLPKVRVAGARVVQGPGTTWIGIVCACRATEVTDCGATVVLAGGARTLRLVLEVHDSVARAVDAGPDSIAPLDVTTQASGDTQWIAVPTSTFHGYRHALIQTSVGTGYRTGSSTPVVDVRL